MRQLRNQIGNLLGDVKELRVEVKTLRDDLKEMRSESNTKFEATVEAVRTNMPTNKNIVRNTSIVLPQLPFTTADDFRSLEDKLADNNFLDQMVSCDTLFM